MEELNIVTKDDKCRGSHADLRHIVDLEAATLIGGRLNADHRVAKNVIEHTRGYTHNRLTVDVNNTFKQIGDTLTCLCRNIEDGRVRHISQFGANLVIELVYRVVVFFNQIPLVNYNNNCLACLVCNACNFGVLIGNAG